MYEFLYLKVDILRKGYSVKYNLITYRTVEWHPDVEFKNTKISIWSWKLPFNISPRTASQKPASALSPLLAFSTCLPHTHTFFLPFFVGFIPVSRLSSLFRSFRREAKFICIFVYPARAPHMNT